MLRQLSLAKRILALATLVVPFLCLPLALAFAQAEPKKLFDPGSKSDILKRSVPFQPPPVARNFSRKENIVEVELAVSMKVYGLDIDGNGKPTEYVRTRSYNCKLCGPVIRVKRGDQLKIRLKNDIDKNEPDVPYEEAKPNKPHGFNITNLHTHGLNVSPEGRSDNVSLEVAPGEYLDLCFDIHPDHPCGTFWYHAHKHGSVAMQLAGGMAGVLIVEDDKNSLDQVPAIKAAMENGREKILVFQQLPYRAVEGKVAEVLAEDVYAHPKVKEDLIQQKILASNTLINGELQPTIVMKQGEVQRWRCVHAGLESSLTLVLVDKKANNPMPNDYLKFHEIAVDGLPLGTLETLDKVVLHPGYRSDALVQAPEQPGEYLLQAEELTPRQNANNIRRAAQYLARVVVVGPGPKMELPGENALKKFRLDSVDKNKLQPNKRDVRFLSSADESEFTVNKESYHKDNKPLFDPKINSAEEWTVWSAAGNHPFHIHVNPFEVITLDQQGKEIRRIWRDTYLVQDTDPETAIIRMRFERFTGKTVLHCHNLRHEDQGMMANVEIKGQGDASRCPPVKAGLEGVPGVAAPAWELPDAQSKLHKSADLAGKKVLLVLSRGSDCFHCREQMKLLKANAEKFKQAGVTVVVISPVPVAKLPGSQDFANLLLSDEYLHAFKAFKCHDGRALHGMFAIDKTGKVNWQTTGDDPFMEATKLFEEIGKLN